MPKYMVGLLALVLCGCIPYAFPSLSMTPMINVLEGKDDVHVFRVDISSKHGMPCYGEEEYSLSEIPLVAGRVLPQVQAGLEKGIIIIGVALNYHFHYHDGVRVRLYRPGFELVEFNSWQMGKAVAWSPAKGLEGRVRAIDDLLAAPGTTASSGKITTLRPGSHGEAHRRTLIFAAEEYQRLASTPFPDVSEALRKTCIENAERLRARAAL